jgi:hypothetical protein
MGAMLALNKRDEEEGVVRPTDRSGAMSLGRGFLPPILACRALVSPGRRDARCRPFVLVRSVVPLGGVGSIAAGGADTSALNTAGAMEHSGE